MHRLRRLFETSLGCKLVMAVTGVALLGFVIAHLLGNLQVFQGPRALNDYAALLQSMPGPLWAARAGLLAIFITHVGAALRLRSLNQAARPHGYDVEEKLQASFASRHMILSGLVVLAFVVFHLLHFTFRVVDTGEMTGQTPDGHHDVYGMIITSFQQGWVAASYIAAMVLLGLHLSHGTASVFQTLGWRKSSLDPLIVWGTRIVTALIVIGNCLIPLAIYFHWIPKPGA